MFSFVNCCLKKKAYIGVGHPMGWLRSLSTNISWPLCANFYGSSYIQAESSYLIDIIEDVVVCEYEPTRYSPAHDDLSSWRAVRYQNSTDTGVKGVRLCSQGSYSFFVTQLVNM